MICQCAWSYYLYKFPFHEREFSFICMDMDKEISFHGFLWLCMDMELVNSLNIDKSLNNNAIHPWIAP